VSPGLERRKKILELTIGAGYSRSEAASELGCSLGAVNRVFRTFLDWPEDEEILDNIKKH